MITVDAADLVKIVSAFGSAGIGLGGGVAFFKPFAEKVFAHWLERAKTKAEIEDEKERAAPRMATAIERIVGVMENVEKHLDRLEARQDRVEAHLGVPMTASAVPPQPAAVEPPRRALTDPHLERTHAARAPLPSNNGSESVGAVSAGR